MSIPRKKIGLALSGGGFRASLYHLRYKTGMSNTVEPVKIVTHYVAEDSSILAYKMLPVDGGYTYEVTWYYK